MCTIAVVELIAPAWKQASIASVPSRKPPQSSALTMSKALLIVGSVKAHELSVDDLIRSLPGPARRGTRVPAVSAK
jgi:hypothetical protein